MSALIWLSQLSCACRVVLACAWGVPIFMYSVRVTSSKDQDCPGPNSPALACITETMWPLLSSSKIRMPFMPVVPSSAPTFTEKLL